jgi:hypothetical protein
MSIKAEITCYRCGTCCIAPDISTLRKAVAVPCPHLDAGRRCRIYAHRPPVCREYRPDAVCCALQHLPEGERVTFFLSIYDLTGDEENSE